MFCFISPKKGLTSFLLVLSEAKEEDVTGKKAKKCLQKKGRDE